MADRFTVNQRLQLGVESTSTPGTPVTTGMKLLECYDWTLGIDGDVKFYKPTGHKYDTEQEENTEWVAGTLGGILDYNGVLYPLASVCGSASPVAHGPSVTAKDWIYTPPVTGSATPQTYTAQQGDAVRAHQCAYGIFMDFGYKFTRKDVSVSGKLMGQALSDGITLGSSPTAVAMAPVAAKHINLYLDSSSGALGTTQLTRVLAGDFAFTGVYGPAFFMNRSQLSYTTHVDLAPKAVFKLKMEADANGMAPLSYLQAGTTYWLRVQGLGSAAIATDGTSSTNIYNEFRHDMAIKFNKPSTFADDQGVFAIEWECQVVEDPTWGKAQVFTVTNLLTAL